jgi:hypothetical protein
MLCAAKISCYATRHHKEDEMAAEPNAQLELEPTEVALIIGEEDGSMSVRVVSGRDVPEDAEELAAAPEIVLALAMRLLKDPDFHDEVLDWYYEQPDDDKEDQA